MPGIVARRAPRSRVPAFGIESSSALRVGMPRTVEEVVDLALLDHPAGVHDEDAVADLGHDAQVVRDEHDGRVEPTLELSHQV